MRPLRVWLMNISPDIWPGVRRWNYFGFHEYDGKVTDFSQRSLEAELARLKMFDERLANLNTERLDRKGLLRFPHSARRDQA